jgi:hypothetical protein
MLIVVSEGATFIFGKILPKPENPRGQKTGQEISNDPTTR